MVSPVACVISSWAFSASASNRLHGVREGFAQTRDDRPGSQGRREQAAHHQRANTRRRICFCSSVVAKSMTSGVGKVGVLLEGELHEQVQRLVLHQSWWLVLMLDHDQPQRPFSPRCIARVMSFPPG